MAEAADYLFNDDVVPRLEHIELADARARVRASFVHGLEHLPIRVRLRCG